MAITSATTLTGLVATAYDRAVEFAFQPNLRFAQLAETKKWTLSTAPTPGATIRFTIFSALTAVESAIPENADPGTEAMSKTGRNVTLSEYGKLVTTTNKLRVASFADIDLSAARLVGDNMGKSVDILARAAFDAHTGSAYVLYTSGSVPADVEATAACYLQADDVRYAFNRLTRNDVVPLDGGFYVAVEHPDTVHDLKEETGSGAWRVPKEYREPENIYNGEVGAFEGFIHIVTSQAKVETDGATGTVDLYSNYYAGFQAVGYAEGVAPHLGISGPFDAMQRLMHVFWYSLIGFGEVRRASLFKVFCSSSVGVNT